MSDQALDDLAPTSTTGYKVNSTKLTSIDHCHVLLSFFPVVFRCLVSFPVDLYPFHHSNPFNFTIYHTKIPLNTLFIVLDQVGEKKTLEELAKLDAQDESLVKWKESLGIKAGRHCLPNFFILSSHSAFTLIFFTL
jgi:hypothetical protein